MKTRDLESKGERKNREIEIIRRETKALRTCGNTNEVNGRRMKITNLEIT